MKRVTVTQIQEVQRHPDNIRCVTVVAHVDHGKSTLTDSLLSSAGMLDTRRAGSARKTDTRPDEQARGVTIKSTGVSLWYDIPVYDEDADGGGATTSNSLSDHSEQEAVCVPHVINVIDSPGHVDFSSEVTAALRVTDGAVVVIDCAEGVCIQTEVVMRQALAERVVPSLCINKIDRFILELQHDPETAYQALDQIIRHANDILDTYKGVEVPGFTDAVAFDPRRNVCFAAGKMGFAVTVEDVARRCVARYGSTVAKWTKRLWGDYFWDVEQRRFRKSQTTKDGRVLPRAFAHFVLGPIWEMFERVTAPAGSLEDLAGWLEDEHAITLRKAERELWEAEQQRDLLEVILKGWIPAGPCLARFIARTLPSPIQAMRYRTEILYTGDQSDACAEAMRNCDPDGPLMMYVSKMVPNADFTRFFAFGRVFSGTVRVGQRVWVMAPEYVPGEKHDRYSSKLAGATLWMAGALESVDAVPAGNTVGLIGVDKYLVKTGTLSTHDDAANIAPLRMAVAPVVRRSVRPARQGDRMAFEEGLRKLVKADTSVLVTRENNETVVAGVGDLHLEICLQDLENDYAKVPIVIGEPVVPLRETVIDDGSEPVVCLKKSTNKHNRVMTSCRAMDSDLVTALVSGDLASTTLSAAQVEARLAGHGLSKAAAKAVIALGGNTAASRPNLLVNQSSGVDHLHQVTDSLASGFHTAVAEGPICGEPMHGVCFALEDARFHQDSAHRGVGQVRPAATASMHAALLAGQPRLMEPVFRVEIVAPDTALGGVYSSLGQCRAVAFDDQVREGTPLRVLSAWLPVAESFGFTELLRSNTSGQAFAQCAFSHWDIVEGDPREPGTLANDMAVACRLRKGMDPEIPLFTDIQDAL